MITWGRKKLLHFYFIRVLIYIYQYGKINIIGGEQMKKMVSYKVDEKILNEFNQTSKKNALNKSQWLENKMIEYLKVVK